ncbi:MAG: hypothetical protein KC635_03220 [Myxococcales bacterium]|nr:hypothetical protein [Myxococcales bacterium]MCB9732714.1 hypothetical protein [Deltaproteobacteria bacterium]
MPVDYLILLVLHIAFAATAFAVAMGGPSAVKRARALPTPDAALAAARELVRRDTFAGISYIVAFLTGFALIFVAYGGFKGLHPVMHASMGLIALLIVFGFVFLHPRTKALVTALEARDAAAADKQLKLVNMGAGIAQLVWFVVLVLMVWNAKHG